MTLDVFGVAASSELLRDATVAAAHELGLFEREEIVPVSRRMRALLDVLVGFGVLARAGATYRALHVPPRVDVPSAGWGLIADVIRSDRPLVLDPEHQERMHHHLLAAGADAAAELASWLPATSLLDIGGGAGAYSAAFLRAHPEASATLVDDERVVTLARAELARFAERAQFIAGDARAVQLGEGFGAALLANVLHLHGDATCAQLCAIAARAVAPDGLVIVKDLRVDEGRRGPQAGLLFALNMALYSNAGDVYTSSRIRGWLARAGLVDIEERRLAVSPDSIVVIGRKPPEDVIARRLDSQLSRMGKVAWRELERAGELRDGALPRRLRFPAPLRRMLSRAIAADPAGAPGLESHYTEMMPRMRVAQIVGTAEPAATLMHTPLDWSRLPRLSAVIDRLYAELAASDLEPPLGAPTAAQFRARTPTCAALYMRTHYGACMPLLYGYPADLAYFAARGAERAFDTHAIIDRYLTVPLLHELCHFGRDREALPVHLDECVAGWLGVHVWREFAYPEPGEDDAIYAAPWLAQIGQAVARAFGIPAVLRGHTGVATWRAVLPPDFLDAAARLAWDDWLVRRTPHFLSDTFAPRPWVALALLAGGGESLAGHTLESLAAAPLASLPLRADDEFDRVIVEDALRAMCLANSQIAGSFRVHARVPQTPIEIDAAGCHVTTAQRASIDPVDPLYWLPPAVAARLAVHGITGYSLRLGELTAIPDAAAAICDASRGSERAGYTLVIR